MVGTSHISLGLTGEARVDNLLALEVRGPGLQRFRYENDLVSALVPSFASSLFRSVDANVQTFREVPAARGVPDLSVVRFDPDRVAERIEKGIRCLTTDVEVRVVLALRQRGADLAELAERLNLSRDYLRRSVLPMLTQLGWVEVRAGGAIQLRTGARSAGLRVVTVEAKLRDWRRAFAQARHQQLSADAAYIALDAAHSRVPLGEIHGIAERGIGVVIVDAQTGQHTVAVRPRSVHAPRVTALGRMLVSERCLSLSLNGERAGQVAPVFGWSLPTLN